eukprot:CAMPEP_0172600888 /NCGR_PEP_ID=MMETSP1068-20121228/21047_1 /TAXON_ID=35684 /ORGANISM="Pseudopedinella elastica, Strain CCMP716" /LENGTH=171 /DNA_ID=CAMNT_0013401693 /DNA_START=233 /DNA_END=748 /DNA_ORIENTATION=-
MVTCFIIAAIGDILSQRIAPGFLALNLKQTVTFGLAQFLFFGPVMHYWFGWIAKMDGWFTPNTEKWMVVGAKTLVDQTVGTVAILSGFFVFFGLVTNAMDGTLLSVGIPAILSAGAEKVKVDLWPTLLANWKLWPVANAFNFAVVPLQYQVFFSNFVAVVWNIYLSGAVRA